MAGVTGDMRVADRGSELPRMPLKPAASAENGEVGGCAGATATEGNCGGVGGGFTGMCGVGGGEAMGGEDDDDDDGTTVVTFAEAIGDSTVCGWNGFGEDRRSNSGGGMTENDSVGACDLWPIGDSQRLMATDCGGGCVCCGGDGGLK